MTAVYTSIPDKMSCSRNAFTELEQEIISLFKRKPVIITGAEKDTAEMKQMNQK